MCWFNAYGNGLFLINKQSLFSVMNLRFPISWKWAFFSNVLCEYFHILVVNINGQWPVLFLAWLADSFWRDSLCKKEDLNQLRQIIVVYMYKGFGMCQIIFDPNGSHKSILVLCGPHPLCCITVALGLLNGQRLFLAWYVFPNKETHNFYPLCFLFRETLFLPTSFGYLSFICS